MAAQWGGTALHRGPPKAASIRVKTEVQDLSGIVIAQNDARCTEALCSPRATKNRCKRSVSGQKDCEDVGITLAFAAHISARNYPLSQSPAISPTYNPMVLSRR